VEQDAFVWIWMRGPAKADPATVVSYPWHNDTALWPRGRGRCIQGRQGGGQQAAVPPVSRTDSETETTCFHFWPTANGFRPNDPVATESLFNEIAAAFNEDRTVVEAQHARLSEFGEAALVDRMRRDSICAGQLIDC
jgi:hypothetical protein